MQLTKTIILKLDASDNDLAELLEAFSQGMNYASQIVFDIGKPVGSGQIQKATYNHLRAFVEYKAKEAGIAVIYVNPEYTSQTCPRCNHISRNNRCGVVFRCEKCGYETHADRTGAKNMEHRTRDLRYILESQGGLVSPPDATRLFA